MKNIVRRLAAFAVGFVATLFPGFAALAQTPPDSAAKQDASVTSIYAKPSRISAPPWGPCFGPSPVPRSDTGIRVNALEGLKLQRYPNALLRSRGFLLTSKRQLPLAKEIRVIDLEGLKKVLQRDPNDKRPLLLNFWATWCDPCREEFPDLVKLDGDYKDKGLNFIAISIDDISDLKSEVPKFLNQMKATMPVVLLNMNDPEPAIKIVDATWDGQLPATFLYDKDGHVVFKHFGKIKPDELRAAIDKQIGSKP